MIPDNIGLRAIIESLNGMSIKSIEREVRQIPAELEKQVMRITLETSYDRDFCNALRIPYERMNDEDIQKLKVFSYNVIRLYSDVKGLNPINAVRK